ncbi:MAG TPA: efflux RND transporter periplasmic adaptor subunit [Thermoanaerobaculia bacterium]|nr:efflux RND transporter periplasmic adaptor subunit [Thermoanaerobaculia bacterium]
MNRAFRIGVAVRILGAGLAAAAPKPPARPASLVPARPADRWTADANLMVEREVGIGTRVSGIVDSIQAERGQTVRKGQALATLDQREFELDRRAAEAAFAAADADFQRYKELFAQKLASKAELEQRRARYEQAKVDLEKAKLTIDRSVIRAPFDGIVVDRNARIGQKVLVEDTVPLFRVSALEPLIARVYIAERWLDRLRVGDRVSVASAQFPEAQSSGKIAFLSPVLDPASGTFQVIVTVPRDSGRIFRPGSAVKVTFSPSAR